MLKVGLTGGLASGKSFAAAEFERLGCFLLQADEVGHQVLDESTARAEIVRHFGTSVLSPNGSIDRKELGRVVFAAPDRLARLNAIVHPRVFARLEHFFRDVESRDPAAVGMVEAAIMIESGSYKRYDRLIVAACARNVQIERFLRREAASRQEAESRLARQMPIEEKRRYADFLIDTGGSKQETLRQVRMIYRILRDEAVRSGTEEGC